MKHGPLKYPTLLTILFLVIMFNVDYASCGYSKIPTGEETGYRIINNDNQEDDSLDIIIDRISLGVGTGHIYCGIGVNTLFYPHRNIGVFAGLGIPVFDFSSIAGFSYNTGLKIRLISENHHRNIIPYAIATYGHSGSIFIDSGDERNKLFHDFSFGLGGDFWTINKKHTRVKSYLSYSVLFPMGKSQIDNYINYLETNHQLFFDESIKLPFRVSLGFRFIIR